ncbi:MAG: protein kinase [Bryobacteraceae bacterium]
MNGMGPEEVERVKAIYARALSITVVEEREKYLREACGGDRRAEEEIRRLLEWHAAAGDFLNTPLVHGGPERDFEGGSLGPWKLLRRIGMGGSATVYLAQRGEAVRETAAVKVLNRFSHSREDFLRFEQETRILARLAHPGVVRFLEAGTTGEAVAYIATEYVDGKPLDEFVRGLAVEEKVRLFVKICEIVAYAHRHRVVHRDLKPSNVLVCRDGSPKVLDFGIALLEDSDTRLTLTGLERMSLPYASPEQVKREKDIGAASDVYSLGVLLYETLAGHSPYSGPEHVLPLRIVADAPLAMRGVPAALEAIARKAMAKEAGARYASVEALGADLEAFLAGGSVAALGGGNWGWRRRTWLAAAMVGAGGIYIAGRQRGQRGGTEVFAQNGVEELTGFRFSNDGRYLVYVEGSEFFEYSDVFLRDTVSGKVRPITRDGAVKLWPSLSPDGKWIAFHREPDDAGDSRIVRMPVDGGEEQVMAVGTFFHYTWGRDAGQLVIAQRSDAGIWPHLRGFDAGSRRRWEITAPPREGRGDQSVTLSPDGATLCFVRLESRESADLYLLPVDRQLRATSRARRLTSRRLRAMFPHWSPGGRELIYASGTLGNFTAFRVAADGRFEPRQIPEAGSGIEALAVAPTTGTMAVARRKAETNIWRLELEGPGGKVVKAEKLPVSTGSEDMVTIAPGGKRIAFESSRSGELQIWVAGANGEDAKQLTTYAALDMVSPLWMPNGEELLVTVRSRNLGLRNYVHPVAGGAIRELSEVDGIPCTFSRDGEWLYFSRLQKDVDLYRYSLRTRAVQQLTHGERVSHAVEAADGRSVYFTKPQANQGLWRWDGAGRAPVRVLSRLARRNLFAVREEGIYYMDRDQHAAVLWFLPASGGQAKELYRMRETPEWGFTIAPDGRTILLTREDLTVSEAVLLRGLVS